MSRYSFEYPLISEDEALPKNGPDGKPPVFVCQENVHAFQESAVICRFSRWSLTEDRCETLFDADFEDLPAVGANVVELERHFNNEWASIRRTTTHS